MAVSDVKEYAHLTAAQVEELGREFDTIRQEIEDLLGEEDAAYIRKMITLQRRLAVAARVTLFASAFPPAWVAGTAMLGVAKILENIEIGHNVMHGQWDWMNDPEIHSTSVGVGHDPAGRAVATLAQLHPPHVHQRAGTRQRHRLRHHARHP